MQHGALLPRARRPEDGATREQRLKRVGVPSALYLSAFKGNTARSTILDVLACLAKDFEIQSEEAIRHAAYAKMVCLVLLPFNADRYSALGTPTRYRRCSRMALSSGRPARGSDAPC